ncbi:serine carboxypeptidase [Auricularia subglabra TFB-10046 SS5]|nr:serine carboxypeptidase [Auricularia subglabra TFB-10046 SS5]
MLVQTVLTALLSVRGGLGQLQSAFTDSFPAPEQQLHSLSSDAFTTFRHTSYPKHSVRIKRINGFCETTKGVNAYSGYIDVEARHLFFYFFESRSQPEEDPVVMWINGGPGCSSTTGLFQELGPCSVVDDSGPKHNPYSWNSNASVFFVDQPVGVGYSYADYGETVTSTEQAAVDIAAFVRIFFETFSSFAGREFHLSGESYAGRYLPAFAAEIYDANTVAKAAGRPAVNLKSVLIGNGFTDFRNMALSSYDMLCTPVTFEPLLPVATCVRMKAALPRCDKWFTKSCIDTFDEMACHAAFAFCSTELNDPSETLGRNLYNLGEVCEEGEPCGVTNPFVLELLNRPDLRKKLGVDKRVGNFTGCSLEVGEGFGDADDFFRPSRAHVEELLERGIRVLQFSGTYDWVCNWVGNLNNVHEMHWTGREEFNKQPLKEWMYEGKTAGVVKSAHGLTFATIDGAGHLVPKDKPAEALHMLRRWLDSRDL